MHGQVVALVWLTSRCAWRPPRLARGSGNAAIRDRGFRAFWLAGRKVAALSSAPRRRTVILAFVNPVAAEG
jgi:hypothetical protein